MRFAGFTLPADWNNTLVPVLSLRIAVKLADRSDIRLRSSFGRTLFKRIAMFYRFQTRVLKGFF